MQQRATPEGREAGTETTYFNRSNARTVLSVLNQEVTPPIDTLSHIYIRTRVLSLCALGWKECTL